MSKTSDVFKQIEENKPINLIDRLNSHLIDPLYKNNICQHMCIYGTNIRYIIHYLPFIQINYQNDDGNALFHLALQYRRFDLVHYILKKIEFIDINIKNKKGKDVLQSAINIHNCKIIFKILVNINKFNKWPNDVIWIISSFL